MAVPGASSNYLRNTTGGSFSSTRQGGTILGNTTVGSVISKALSLIDNAIEYPTSPLPVALDNGLVGAGKALSSGTFAYFEAGKYVIKTISDTISGVATNAVLSPAADNGDRRSINRFRHDFGVRLLTKWRANEFSWTGVLDDGTKIKSRLNWLNAAGDGAEAPATLTDSDMWDPVAGATSPNSDSAANPTRAIPGELVMKADFVDLSVATGGDFFDYKPITGM